MKKLIACIIVLSILVNCPLIFAAAAAVPAKEVKKAAEPVKIPEPDAVKPASVSGCEDGKRDAGTETNGFLWCLGGAFVIPAIIGLFIEPQFAPDRLTGKTAEYAQEYTKCYRDEAKGTILTGSIIGCTVGSATAVLVTFAIIAAVQQSLETAVSNACSQACLNIVN